MKNLSRKNLNIDKNYYSKKEISLIKKIFFKMSLVREFELQAYENRKNNKFKTLIYLSLGQESIYATVSEAIKNPSIFGQHRAHGIYLSYGGDAEKLVDELIGLQTGTNKGMGGSPPIFDKKIGMFGHIGLIGDQVPVACGFALASKKKTTICFFGDGAAEEDYVIASLGFAAQKKLNILFICDDNDFSVLTPTKDRRSWNLSEVAKSFGIKSLDITDDPMTIYKGIKMLHKKKFPALINIRTCREYWHEGAGKDKRNKYFWSRYDIIKEKLIRYKKNDFVFNTESKNKEWAKNLWLKRLQTQ